MEIKANTLLTDWLGLLTLTSENSVLLKTSISRYSVSVLVTRSLISPNWNTWMLRKKSLTRENYTSNNRNNRIPDPTHVRFFVRSISVSHINYVRDTCVAWPKLRVLIRGLTWEMHLFWHGPKIGNGGELGSASVWRSKLKVERMVRTRMSFILTLESSFGWNIYFWKGSFACL